MAAYTCTLVLASPSFTASCLWSPAPNLQGGVPSFQDGDTIAYAVTTDGSVAYWDNVPASAITIQLNFQRISAGDPFGGTTLGPVSARSLPLANAQLYTTAPLTIVGAGAPARYSYSGSIVATGTSTSNPYQFSLPAQQLAVGAG